MVVVVVVAVYTGFLRLLTKLPVHFEIVLVNALTATTMKTRFHYRCNHIVRWNEMEEKKER